MNKPLALVAVGALGIALFLSMKKRKAAGSATGSTKRKAAGKRKAKGRKRRTLRRRPASRRRSRRVLAMLPSGRLARVKVNPDFGMAPAIRVPLVNPFRKGKSRRYLGRKHRGTVFKAKGRLRMIVRTRGGKRISRPWARKARR
jgi:hypothetical protein